MIRFALPEDIPGIMRFIDNHWQKNHILSRDRKLFEFQYCWNHEISFVLSEGNNGIDGIMGYIPYANADRDVTLALWKALKTKDVMLGIHILNYLKNKDDIDSISVLGANPKTLTVYRFLGFHTGRMRQWYRLQKQDEYSVALIKDGDIPGYSHKWEIESDELKCFDSALQFGLEACLIREGQLFKSKQFVQRRYFEHPYFQYLSYGLKLKDKKLFLVLRVQSYREHNVLRIIDCMGDHEVLKSAVSFIDELLVKYNCEYVDCFETGIDEMIFREGGWKLRQETENVIPEYFSPFEQKNIEIYYASQKDNVILFRGDGDMDRPN